MNIDVWVERGNVKKKIRHEKDMRIFDVLEMLKISPETIVAVRNGEVALEDEPLEAGDRLELRAVKMPG